MQTPPAQQQQQKQHHQQQETPIFNFSQPSPNNSQPTTSREEHDVREKERQNEENQSTQSLNELEDEIQRVQNNLVSYNRELDNLKKVIFFHMCSINSGYVTNALSALIYQGPPNMSKEEAVEAIQQKIQSMTKEAKALHVLTKKKKKCLLPWSIRVKKLNIPSQEKSPKSVRKRVLKD